MGAGKPRSTSGCAHRPVPTPPQEASMRARCSISPYLCATIGLLGACTSSPTGPSETKGFALPPGAALSLVVAPSPATIEGGQTLRFTASRKDAHGQSLAPGEVAWAS